VPRASPESKGSAHSPQRAPSAAPSVVTLHGVSASTHCDGGILLLKAHRLPSEVLSKVFSLLWMWAGSGLPGSWEESRSPNAPQEFIPSLFFLHK